MIPRPTPCRCQSDRGLCDQRAQGQFPCPAEEVITNQDACGPWLLPSSPPSVTVGAPRTGRWRPALTVHFLGRFAGIDTWAAERSEPERFDPRVVLDRVTGSHRTHHAIR
jgi:hypothetical protein